MNHVVNLSVGKVNAWAKITESQPLGASKAAQPQGTCRYEACSSSMISAAGATAGIDHAFMKTELRPSVESGGSLPTRESD